MSAGKPASGPMLDRRRILYAGAAAGLAAAELGRVAPAYAQVAGGKPALAQIKPGTKTS